MSTRLNVTHELLSTLLVLHGHMRPSWAVPEWTLARCPKCGGTDAITTPTPNADGIVAWLCVKDSYFETQR